MTFDTATTGQTPLSDIKSIPVTATEREAIRVAVKSVVSELDPATPPNREKLEIIAVTVLSHLGYPLDYQGFTMVAISNCFWESQFTAIPYNRRLLLLPHCLSNDDICAGSYDSVGLKCAACGACSINDYQTRAVELGYQVIVAEGTSSVLMKVIDGSADALLGVACLDSLEKSFTRIVDLGIPNIGIPLLQDGCVKTFPNSSSYPCCTIF